jgi:hypothetical protein
VLKKYHEGKMHRVSCYNLEYRLKRYDKGVTNLLLDGVINLSSDGMPTSTGTPISNVLPCSLVATDDISSVSTPFENRC